MRGMAPGPLFIRSNGHFLTTTHFVSEVKKAMEQAGMEASNFNGHSFRIGAASTAAAHGMEDSPIFFIASYPSVMESIDVLSSVHISGHVYYWCVY